MPVPVHSGFTRIGQRTGVETRRARHVAVRMLLGAGIVGAATALFVALGVDFTVAALGLVVVVVAASLLGYAPGVVSAVAAAIFLAYFFTPPLHSFSIEKTDDLLALAAFVAVSLLVGSLVARLNELRRRSELSAQEVRLRLDATNKLLAGTSPATVLHPLAEELATLFDLASCEISAAGTVTRASARRPSDNVVVLAGPAMTLRLTFDRPLRGGELETLEAFAAGLGSALDRTRLQHQTREQELRADLDRARIGFLIAVTHDVRTPIATIKTATGALLGPSSLLDDSERTELLEAAYHESTRLEGLVTKVLDLSRIRAGVKPEPELVDVGDVVRSAVTRVGSAAASRTITLHVATDLPALYVDPVLLEHALANLLENAVVHDPDGDDIEVCAVARGCRIDLAVVDHGPGIAPAERARVFEEFVRLDSPQGRPGTGLGLTIVRALTEAHGGHVRVESTPGGGATFVLDLPAEGGEQAGSSVAGSPWP